MQSKDLFFSSPAAYLLVLHRALANHPALFSKLLQHYGTAEGVYASIAEITATHKLPRQAASALKSPDWQGVEKDLLWLGESEQHFILPVQGADYPEPLRQISDPPALLFGYGDRQLLHSASVALVGSRRASAGGLRRAASLATELAKNGITVTSGLAVGVDGSAHKAVVAANGKALAVLGSGIDRIYPKAHLGLAEDIVRLGGLVLSEFPIGTPPLPHHFPQRNRIISGLSRAVVVVEAAMNSGSLITARLAAEQGREVLAVPGNPDNPLSRGCHWLLRDGAGLVESGEDILQSLGICPEPGQSSGNGKPATTDKAKLPENMRQLLDAVDYDAISVESIAHRCGLTAGEVSSMLFELEGSGYVVLQLDGNYCRVR